MLYKWFLFRYLHSAYHCSEKKLEKLTKVLEKKLILKTENVPSKLAIFTRLKNKLEALVFLGMKGSENMQSLC